jgi:death-on-curing protein
MTEYLTVAEVYRMQHRLIELFGGLHTRQTRGVRDKGAVEAAVFRPQTGYYSSIEEEAAALMESLANNHGFVDGNKRIGFTAADVFLRRNGYYLDVEGVDGYAFIVGSMEPGSLERGSLDRHEFRFGPILDWIRRHIKPLV